MTYLLLGVCIGFILVAVSAILYIILCKIKDWLE